MSNNPEDLKQEIEDLKTSHATQAATQAGAQATQAATQAGAQATQAATQAGQASTMAATQAGTWSTMAAGAIALIVGVFLGLAIANSK